MDPEAAADLGGGAEERGPGGGVTGAHPAPLPPGAEHARAQVSVDSTAVCCWVLDLIPQRGISTCSQCTYMTDNKSSDPYLL